MIRERRTKRWRCKFELLAVGDCSEQIAPLSRGVGGATRRSVLRSKAPHSLSLCPHNSTAQHCAIYSQNATLKSKTAKAYAF
jgi:hypothetical protein